MPRPLLSALGDAAAGYAQRGWPVLPLHAPIAHGCSCHEATCQSAGKHPRTRHGLRDATTDLDQITAWWRKWPYANVGVATGRPSSLIVIDVDPEHGGETSLRQLDRACPLPRTAQAGSGTGRHLYYAARDRIPSSIGRLGDGIDIRADGSYIIAPPSRHACGRPYRWIVSTTIAMLPPALITRLAPPQASHAARPHTPITDVSAYCRAALAAEIRAVAGAPTGQRNNTLYQAALKLGRLTGDGGLTELMIADHLAATAAECGLPRLEAHRTIASGMRASTRMRRWPPTPEHLIELD